jgi:hypothetical protein
MIKNSARAFLAAALLWAASALPALAQSYPNWGYGFVPTPAQWKTQWASKQDYLGAPPLLTTGGTMVGKLVTATSNTTFAGLNLQTGVAPTTPVDGDMWITTTGVFARINGTTVGPLGSGGGGGSFAATSPITYSTPAGVNTFACPTCGVTGSALSQFAPTTSAQLAGVISDETGSGSAVFANAPALTNPTVGTQSANDNSTKAASTAYVDRVKKVLSSNTTFNYGPGGSDANGCTNNSTDKCLTMQGAYDNVVDGYTVKGAGTLVTIQADTNTAYTGSLVTGRCLVGQNTPGTLRILGQIQTAATVTVSIASPGVVTWTAHGFSANQPFFLSTTGALPTNATVYTKFFVKTVVDANNFTFSATAGGTAINTTGTQSGTHTATSLPNTSIITTSVDAISLGAMVNGAGTQGCSNISVGGFAIGTVTAGNAINLSGGGVGLNIGINNYPVEFVATAQDHMVGNHAAWTIGGSNIIVSGGALIHVAGLSSSQTALHLLTETFLTTNGVVPAFTYFAYADVNAMIYLDAMTFTNASIVTGTRCFVQNFSTIYTLSASTTYLPGNSACVRQSFGNYVTNTPSIWNPSDGGTGQTSAGTAGQVLTSNGSIYQPTDPGVQKSCFRNVDFSQANHDNQITINSPTSTYAIFRIFIANASASLTTATLGVFSATGGGGTPIITATAVTVATNAANTNNNMQAIYVGSTTQSWNFTTLQARTVATASGTADVCIYWHPI